MIKNKNFKFGDFVYIDYNPDEPFIIRGYDQVRELLIVELIFEIDFLHNFRCVHKNFISSYYDYIKPKDFLIEKIINN